MSKKKPIARVWVDSKSYLIYKLPVMGEIADKIELYRPLTVNEKTCIEPLIADAEVVLCYVKEKEESY